MMFERNPHYHGNISGNVQRLTVNVTEPGDDGHEQLYQADEVDVVVNSFGTKFGVIDRLRAQFPHEYEQRGDGFITYFYRVDHESPPLDDRRLRQAMALAIDREALARAWGRSVPAYGGCVPPGIPGHLPGIAAAYDPDYAARIIADCVGKDPPTVRVIGAESVEPFVQRLVEAWRAVGLSVELELCATGFDQNETWSTTAGPKVGVRGWLADYPDPDTFLRVAVNDLIPGWQADGYTALLERATRISDLASRLTLYREAEQILAQEAVLVPVLYLREHLMVKPWVARFPTVPFLFPVLLKDVVIGPQEQDQ
jgi:ABC-type oligopeptide transport system substrate-binding subunit